MKLRDEMVERAKAVPQIPLGQANISGWSFTSDAWDDATQNAVDQIMVCANVLLEMVLRLAESIDELRDAPDV